MSISTDHAVRTVLGIDALTCLLGGVAMALGATILAGPTGLDILLLRIAGCSLFPVAALFAWMARSDRLNAGLVLLAVAGNAGWVAASLATLVLAGPTPFGSAFILAQAIAVAILAWLEYRALPGRKDRAAA